jgi:hypothetical protein
MSTSAQAAARAGDDQAGGRRRWLILLSGMAAMTAGCAFQYGLAYLIPALRREGLSLEQAGLLVACPTAGLLLTLVAWGAAADRWGERLVLGSGLALAGGLLLAGAATRTTAGLAVCLLLAGAAGASVYAASGRLIPGRAGPRHPEHRAERVRGRHAPGDRGRHRVGRVPGGIRRGRVLPAAGGRARARGRGAPGGGAQRRAGPLAS